MDLNKLAKEIHEEAKAKGFYDEYREDETFLMLIVSELAEALEAHINGLELKKGKIEKAEQLYKKCNFKSLKAFKAYFMFEIEDTLEDNLVDAMIRILDFAEYKGWKVDIQDDDYLKTEFVDMPPFSVALFQITSGLCMVDEDPEQLFYVFGGLMVLCDQMNIDWKTHIELKRRYNKLRESVVKNDK